MIHGHGSGAGFFAVLLSDFLTTVIFMMAPPVERVVTNGGLTGYRRCSTATSISQGRSVSFFLSVPLVLVFT